MLQRFILVAFLAAAAAAATGRGLTAANAMNDSVAPINTTIRATAAANATCDLPPKNGLDSSRCSQPAPVVTKEGGMYSCSAACRAVGLTNLGPNGLGSATDDCGSGYDCGIYKCGTYCGIEDQPGMGGELFAGAVFRPGTDYCYFGNTEHKGPQISRVTAPGFKCCCAAAGGPSSASKDIVVNPNNFADDRVAREALLRAAAKGVLQPKQPSGGAQFLARDSRKSRVYPATCLFTGTYDDGVNRYLVVDVDLCPFTPGYPRDASGLKCTARGCIQS